MGVSDSILGGLSGVVTNDASAMVGDLAGGGAALQTILAELKASEAAALAESPAASATLLTNGVPTSDPYNLQQYSPWLSKSEIATPTGKDIYGAIISAGLAQQLASVWQPDYSNFNLFGDIS